MDGNGRWANQQGKARAWGHRKGIDATKKVVLSVLSHKIPFLSLYAFSTENWKRTSLEVNVLMQLIEKHLRKEIPFYLENDIKVIFSGRKEDLPEKVIQAMNEIAQVTANNQSLTVNLLINYGGRDEILRAVQKIRALDPTTDVDEKLFQTCLDHGELPEVDLLIRTGGESRISNFMIWQVAYAEIFISPLMWPSWGDNELSGALDYFVQCDRKFGGIPV